jgi:hypothetical protein
VQQQQRVVHLERSAEPEKDDAGHSGDANRHQAIDIGAGNYRDDPGNYSRADEQGEIDGQADIAELLRLQRPFGPRFATGDASPRSSNFRLGLRISII